MCGFHAAVLRVHDIILQLFLDRGANDKGKNTVVLIDEKDIAGNAALHIARSAGQTETAAMLLSLMITKNLEIKKPMKMFKLRTTQDESHC